MPPVKPAVPLHFAIRAPPRQSEGEQSTVASTAVTAAPGAPIATLNPAPMAPRTYAQVAASAVAPRIKINLTSKGSSASKAAPRPTTGGLMPADMVFRGTQPAASGPSGSSIRGKAKAAPKTSTAQQLKAKSKKQLCQEKKQLEQALQVLVPAPPVVGTFFHYFERLPAEMRVMIWKMAGLSKQRFIGFKFDEHRFKLPPIFLASKESNYEAKKHIWDINHPNWGLIANPKADILLLDEVALPPSNDRGFHYHRHVFHSLTCTTNFVIDYMKPFTKIAVTMAEVYQIWSRECIHCWMLRRLFYFFPNFTELNLVLRLGAANAEPEEMWVLNDQEKVAQIDQFDRFIREFEYAWARCVKADGRFKAVTLNFVRMERWAR